jgi:predicted O-methyltransferase YrrM
MGSGLRLLEEIRASGFVTLADGTKAALESGIDEPSGRLLRRLILEARPDRVVEVGLGYGVSTLYMLDALEELGSGVLIGMDPVQRSARWRAGGLENVRRAGLERFYQFHEEPSQSLLPRLWREGTRAQLGLIDGWHTFDHTLIDFFFLDAILEPGGIIALDDVGYPAIRRVCDFILTNRDYELVEAIRYKSPRSVPLRRAAKSAIRRVLDPFVRTERTPGLSARAAEATIENVSFAALRKRADDSRTWDHFVAF